MSFKLWLELAQPVSLQQVQQILSHSGPISTHEVRVDFLQQAAKQGRMISFDPQFPVSNIGRRIQGYDMTRVLQMINVIFQTLGIPQVQNLQQINRQSIATYSQRIIQMLPPIIVSIMPDESYHLSDGNHRIGIAHVLGLQTLKAFEIQP